MSEERTIRTGPRKGFVVLYRSAAQDARLSLEARGLLVMMASLPDNWSYSETGLASKAGCGRQKVNRILRELIDAGYLLREQRHGEHGKFASCTYVLQEEAQPERQKKNRCMKNRQRLNRQRLHRRRELRHSIIKKKRIKK